MRKSSKFVAVAGIVAVTASAALAGTASASQPANPGGFGQERAANLQDIRDGVYSTDLPGASYWAHNADGAVARGGDNGKINNDWKVANGYLPAGVTPGQ